MGELVFFIKNYQYQSTIQIQAQLISPQCWDVDPNDYDKHDLTNSYPGGLSTRTLPPSQNYAQWIAFDLCFSRDLLEPYLGLGKYQITVYEIVGGVYFPKATMTVDYRTSHLPEAVWGGTGVSPDLYFDYDDLTDKLYYAHTTVQPVDVRIWDKQGINLIETELEPLPPSNFNIPNKNQFQSNPQLVWDHSLASNYRTGYAVYRREAIGSYQKIATLSKNTTSYTDQNTVISEAGENIRYYVKTINGNRESDPSPSISVVGGVLNKISSQPLSFNLQQNYPNPFNPTTTIAYTIPNDEHVTLKIYNTLGEEVAELVNEIKSAGIYQTNFNAENLPSGIYIYKITAGKYTDSKKLLLVK